MMNRWKNILLIMLLFGNSGLIYAQDSYYRYRDQDGNTVISSTLPPEVANQGYEVVSTTGNVIEKVDPKKSDAQIQEELKQMKLHQKQKKHQKELKQAEQEQTQRDEVLLQSFSSEADILRAKEDKIKAIEVMENIVKENLTGIERQLKTAQKMAQSALAQDGVIPENIQKTIDDSVRQIKENHEFLKRKEIEKQEIRLKHNQLIERFKLITKDRAPAKP